MNILIAEDEPLMRERLLGQLAHSCPEARIVAVAENGNDAWDAWLEHEPDVVFLDIQMPGLTGLEVARRIAERSHIVFVTAYDQHALEAFQRGAVDYLLKPVELAVLERTVARLRRRTQRPVALAPVLKEIAQPTPQRLKWLKASIGKQIHRGTIVNAHAIATVERTDNERLHLTVKGSDEVLVVSRSFTHLFRD